MMSDVLEGQQVLIVQLKMQSQNIPCWNGKLVFAQNVCKYVGSTSRNLIENPGFAFMQKVIRAVLYVKPALELFDRQKLVWSGLQEKQYVLNLIVLFDQVGSWIDQVFGRNLIFHIWWEINRPDFMKNPTNRIRNSSVRAYEVLYQAIFIFCNSSFCRDLVFVKVSWKNLRCRRQEHIATDKIRWKSEK